MTKPAFGPASILGYLSAAAGFVTATVLAIEHNQALLTGQNKPAALLAFAALLATNAHRAFESAHLNRAAGVAQDVSQLPDALAALAAEAQANVAAAGTDGVDGPHVAFSGPEQPPA